MSKKDKAPKEPVKPGDYTTQLMAEIIEKYGEGTIKPGDELLTYLPKVIKVSPNLDVGLGGGIPEGSWVSISGPPKVGKTSMLLAFAATCQREEFGGRTIYYFNIERRLKEKNLKGTKGLNWQDRNKFVVIESDKTTILSAQDFLDIASMILKSHPGCVIILDSISSLVDSVILDGGMGTQTRGSGAKIVSQFIDLVKDVVPIQKSIVLGVTHIIANTSGFGASKVEKAPNRWLYQADIRLKATHATPWVIGGSKGPDGKVSGGTQIGQTTHWQVQESALGAPGANVDGWLRYGTGIDHAYELLESALALKLITQAGAWYTLSFMAKHLDLIGQVEWDEEAQKLCKAQGKEKTYQLLEANPEWMAALSGDVSRFLGVAA